MNKHDNYIKGRLGERIAQHHVIKKGMEILCTNYRCKCGEIDIIARDEGTLVFYEVKSRTNEGFGSGGESVDSKKRNRIKKSAMHFIQSNEIYDVDIRFDVIEIYFEIQKIKFVENAF